MGGNATQFSPVSRSFLCYFLMPDRSPSVQDGNSSQDLYFILLLGNRRFNGPFNYQAQLQFSCYNYSLNVLLYIAIFI